MFVLFVCLFFFCGEPRRPSAKGTLAAAVTKKRRKTKDERRLTFVCASRSRPRGSSHPSASASASASQETRMAVGRSADVSISRSHWPETSPVGVARSHGAPATSAAEGGSGEPPLRCPSIFIDLFFFLFFFWQSPSRLKEFRKTIRLATENKRATSDLHRPSRGVRLRSGDWTPRVT